MKKLFSLIALVGMIAACTPEEVESAFKLSGGRVIVNVEVVDLINGGDYTGQYTVSSPFGTVSGNTITYQAEENQPVNAANYVVTVSGPKLAKDYTANFAVPAVLAGGEAILKVVVPVGEPLNGYTIEDVEGKATSREVINYLINKSYPTHNYSHAGVDFWYYNDTEFKLDAVVNYLLEFPYVQFISPVDNKLHGFEGIVQTHMDNYEGALMWDGEDRDLKFTVSAYSMWNVIQTVTHNYLPVTVTATKGSEKYVLGSFTVDYVYSSEAEPHELAYPGHEGHYHAGHGHDAHGTKPNAGGGMSMND